MNCNIVVIAKFSEENEMVVDSFLSEHPEFTLVPVKESVINSTSDGIKFDSCKCENIHFARRFYPHKAPGEGQFVALLQRDADSSATPARADAATVPNKKDAQTVWDFLKDVLKTHPEGRLVQLRDDVYLTPDIPVPPRGVFAPGVCLGTLQKGRLVPHHQLFSAYGTDFRRQISLTKDDPRVEKYLRGEEIDAEGEGGVCAVLFEGAPLGGGKLVGGKVKNYYPKGLRNRN